MCLIYFLDIFFFLIIFFFLTGERELLQWCESRKFYHQLCSQKTVYLEEKAMRWEI